ncbi:MAG: DedA family protein [Bacteroidaceae bacterium]|nr:DedA family protein [Bacteroidaceae bacterium]
MESLFQFLIDHGVAGMFVSAFLAGSIIPLSSEFVMAGLIAAGVAPLHLLVAATVGNTLGSMFNYGIGTLGREEWIERWLKVKPEQLERGKRHVNRYGYWVGLLSWLPVVGELLTVAMGFLRTRFVPSLITIFIGKLVRYWLILAATTGAMTLI